jgi:hypothetical protein
MRVTSPVSIANAIICTCGESLRILLFSTSTSLATVFYNVFKVVVLILVLPLRMATMNDSRLVLISSSHRAEARQIVNKAYSSYPLLHLVGVHLPQEIFSTHRGGLDTPMWSQLNTMEGKISCIIPYLLYYFPTCWLLFFRN